MAGLASATERQIIEAIHEFLLFRGLDSSRRALEEECAISGSLSSNDGALGKVAKSVLLAFQNGVSSNFWSLWKKHIPVNILERDPTCHRLAFSIHVHFAVFPLRQGHDPQSQLCRAALKEFRDFLDGKGQRLAQTSEFVEFFALPYVPDARTHPTFKDLFRTSWTEELQSRIEEFLKSVLPKQIKPVLLKVLPSIAETSACSAGPISQVRQLQCQLSECEERALIYIRKHAALQADYRNVLGVATELVKALEDSVTGRQLSAEYLQSLCVRLFGSAIQQSADFSRPATTVSLLRTSLTELNVKTAAVTEPLLLPPLDFGKIKESLGQLGSHNKALLLQALRLRISQTAAGEQRNHVMSAYVENDLLGCSEHGQHEQRIMECLTSADPVLCEMTARLINAFVSLKLGRAYVSRHPGLLPHLQQVLKQTPLECPAQRSVLAALQKLSLLRSQQSQMIKAGLISWLVSALREHDSLSDSSLHYASALLMNLCLRTAGKHCCIGKANEVLSVLLDLLESEDMEVRSYINGTLYSLLTVPEIREEAKAMGLEPILEGLMKVSPPNMASQLEFILKQLGAGDNNDGSESDEDNDDDEEEVDALEDVDTDDVLVANPGDLSGEDLLCQCYLSLNERKPVYSAHKVSSLDLKHPLDRPVTPRHHINQLNQIHVISDSKKFSSRPTTRDQNRAAALSSRSEARGRSAMSAGQANRPLSGKRTTTENTSPIDVEPTATGGLIEAKEYHTAFASRPKLARTPDKPLSQPSSYLGSSDNAGGNYFSPPLSARLPDDGDPETAKLKEIPMTSARSKVSGHETEAVARSSLNSRQADPVPRSSSASPPLPVEIRTSVPSRSETGSKQRTVRQVGSEVNSGPRRSLRNRSKKSTED